MPRYHFNLLDDETLFLDHEGANFRTLEAAYLEAFASAQEIWARRIAERRDPMNCSFQIADHAGDVVFVLPFCEILEDCTGATWARRPRPVSRGSVGATVERSKRLRTEMSAELKCLSDALGATRQLLSRSGQTDFITHIEP